MPRRPVTLDPHRVAQAFYGETFGATSRRRLEQALDAWCGNPAGGKPPLEEAEQRFILGHLQFLMLQELSVARRQRARMIALLDELVERLADEDEGGNAAEDAPDNVEHLVVDAGEGEDDGELVDADEEPDTEEADDLVLDETDDIIVP